MSVYEKLLTIQQKLKAPKNQYNKFGHFYYRSCEDILEAVKPLCYEHKVVLTLCDGLTEIGCRIYVTATAKLHDIEDGSSFECQGYAHEDEDQKGKDAPQITGSCSSYARKYALNGLFCIDDSKVEPAADPDAGIQNQKAESQEANEQNQQPAQKINNEQLAQLQAMAKQKGTPIEKIVQGYQLNSLQDMNTMQWAQAMNILRKRADAV